jgi:hypothetical protein
VEPVVRYRHQFSTGGLFRQRKPAVIDSRSAYNSVGAVVRWDVRRVVWATEAIVVNAADEMMPSSPKVPLIDVRHATGAYAVDVLSADTSDATDAQATHVTSANVTHTGTDVTSAKAAHTATVSSAATAAPSLCARGKKAAGKHCACQNHHHSSSHDILHLIGRIVPPQDLCQTLACSAQWTSTSRYNGDENAQLFSQLNSSLLARLSRRERTQNRELE